MAEISILLVEDNPGDVRMIERLFDDQGLSDALRVATTGSAALDRLYCRGEFAGTPRPDLVLLDLNLPATSGHDVLETIKSDPGLKRIPVIVLTSSQSEEDLIEAYGAFANAYLLKPVDPDEFEELIGTFADFWVSAAVLPPASDPPEDD